MSIKVPPKVHEFASLILKHYKIDDTHKETESDILDELTRPNPNDLNQIERSKASTDYRRWEGIEKKIPDEKKKSEFGMEEPKEGQVWGCAQDHRKVIG